MTEKSIEAGSPGSLRSALPEDHYERKRRYIAEATTASVGSLFAVIGVASCPGFRQRQREFHEAIGRFGFVGSSFFRFQAAR
jgi:hypothetical protein